MSTQKLGVSNLLPLIMLGVEMGNVGDKMGRTKGMQRYMHLTALFDEVTALGQVDFKQALAEAKDLDPSETQMIHEQLKVKFDIVDDKLELAIEEGLKIVEEAYGLVNRSITLYKGITKEEAQA